MSQTGALLRVRNWEKFQHYGKRNPPWIRLYNELLDNYEFSRLQDASKWHAVGIWLLASRFDNAIPSDPIWIGQRINARSKVDIPALVSAGFVELYDSASNVLAECKQDATLEVEVETEKRKARAGQLPADWTPNDTHQRIANEEGADIDREAIQFKDHALATGRVLKDWDAGFRTWLRKAKGMNGRKTWQDTKTEGEDAHHREFAKRHAGLVTIDRDGNLIDL